jgi:hypothetical protein
MAPMNRWVRLVFLVSGAVAGFAQNAPNAAGHWQGKIQIPDHELGMTVDLAKNAKGVWIGSMSVLGSTSIDVPLSGIAIEGSAVRFSATLPQPSKFEGRFSGDGASLSGTASSAAGEAPFQMTRSGEANVKVPPPSSVLSKEFEGTWEGVLEAGGKSRRIGLKILAAADGTANAVLIVIEQGNLEIRVGTVTIRDKELQLAAPAVSGTYRGTLANGEIAGEWTQGGNHAALVFKKP